MKLSAFKEALAGLDELHILQPNGTPVPAHFHLTELGLLTKHFVDCGHTVRKDTYATMQLWVASDTDHRLRPQALIAIIDESATLIPDQDIEIEVEFQQESISKYGLEFENGMFRLTNKYTDCLAKDNCGVPQEKKKIKLSELQKEPAGCCAPGSGCC